MAQPASLQRYPQYAAKMQKMELYNNGPLYIYGLTEREAQTIRTQFYGYRKTFASKAKHDPMLQQQIIFAESLTVRVREIQPDEMSKRRPGKDRPEHCKVLICAPFHMLGGELDSMIESAIEEQMQMAGSTTIEDEKPEVSSGVAKFMERFKDSNHD